MNGEKEEGEGEKRKKGKGKGNEQKKQELRGRQHGGIGKKLRIGEHRGPIDGDEEVELALSGLNLGDIDVKVADRVALELLLRRLVTFNIRQATDVVALQAAVQ